MFETNLFGWWIVCAIISAIIGATKGELLTGLFWGFILGPIGIVITIVRRGDAYDECPYCVEPVRKGAVKCPHCKSRIG